MTNPMASPNFVNLGNEPTLEDPLNLLPLQAEVPFPSGQSLLVIATHGGPSIADKLQALLGHVPYASSGKRPHSPSAEILVKSPSRRFPVVVVHLLGLPLLRLLWLDLQYGPLLLSLRD